MRGRKPKPLNILKMEKGKLYDEQGDREKIEIRPPETEMICPGWLTDLQKIEWYRMAEILKSIGLLVNVNEQILEMLAINISEYKESIKQIEKDGIVLENYKTGTPYLNPWWKIQKDCHMRIMKCLQELGLSSVGLARLGSLEVNKKRKDEKSETEKLLG